MSDKRPAKYIVNGKEYASIDDVPAELRRFLEDKDGDGQSDFIQEQFEQLRGHGIPLDGKLPSGTQSSFTSVTMTTVNGKTTYRVGDQQYDSLDEVPAEYRKMFEDRDGDGRPELHLGSLLGQFPGARPSTTDPLPTPKPPREPVSTFDTWDQSQDRSSAGIFLFLAGVLVGGLLLAAIGAAVLLLM